MQIIPGEDNVIKVSPLTIEMMNMDFDGDSAALYIIHDRDALQEMYEKAFVKNVIFCDSNTDILSVIRHEALYAAYVITENIIDKNDLNYDMEIDSLKDLPETLELYEKCLNLKVKLNNNTYSYGICLFNKWMYSDRIIINKTIANKQAQEISKLIYFNICKKDSNMFHNIISEIERKLFFFLNITNHCPSLNVEEMASLVDIPTDKLFKKLPDNNVYLGYYINEALVERCLYNFDTNAEIYKLFKSGSRFSKTQLARSCINVGYSADGENIVNPNPVTSNLLQGLTEIQFFAGADGTKKGIFDKAKVTPDSGYLERTVAMALAIMEITEDDCGTERGIKIKLISKDHASTLIGKYFKCAEENLNEWTLIKNHKQIMKYYNKELELRTPMLCATPDLRICKKCFGEKEIRTRYAGISAGQCSIERLTQLIMRVFHTSGASDLNTYPEIILYMREYLRDIEIHGDNIYLYFNEGKIPKKIKKIPGFKSIKKNFIHFKAYKKQVYNNDTISTVNSIKNILKTNKKVIKKPDDYYIELIELLLSVGNIYSTYIEMMLAHMFVTNKEKKELWRYNPNDKIVLKLSDKTLATFISPLLGLLYQPNKNSIANISLDEMEQFLNKTETIDASKLSIYERIFLGLN